MPINWILGHKPQHIEQGLKHVKNGTIKGRVHQTHTPSRMDSQCCACTQERCESENMCKGLEQSLP